MARTLRARLAELPADKETGSAADSPRGREQLGITVDPLTPETAAQLGLRRNLQGVVVTDVDPSGPAAEAGIQADDVILEVNHRPVKSSSDLPSALRESGSRPALLLVNRKGRSLFIAVRPS